MLYIFRLAFTLACLSVSLGSQAIDTVRVSDKVYALTGDLGQRSPQNLGHNMTSGFIVTDDGIVVIDTGGSLANAEAIHAAIRKVTDRKIIYAINTGGQDHRWFGNDYFRGLGAKIIATESAAKDMRARGAEQVERIKPLLGGKFSGTELVYPDTTFAQRMTLPVNGITIELIYTGGGHTPGDLLVWLPAQSTVFAGDTVFAERMLGVLPGSSGRWIKSLEYLRDTLKPRIVVPGHGKVTDMKQSLRDSYDYLVFLRDAVKKRFADGAFDPVEASQNLDQSRFSYLKNYEDLGLRSRNALAVAEELFNVTSK
ncbi:MAG: MBL fold metallo-hydrolase [Burkholderiales bacterium]|nr:MBL fold metallo-hydrolase [Burkholderiales bacterium]